MASNSERRVIRTFVFYDVETTSKTTPKKMVEMCLIAVRRATLYHTNTLFGAKRVAVNEKAVKQTASTISGRPTYQSGSCLPRIMEKIVLYFDPDISPPGISKKTGLSTELLKSAGPRKFHKHTVDIMHQFFERQDKPICLVAHNGSRSEFKILMRELEDIGENLPADLLCMDSIFAFQSIEPQHTKIQPDASPELISDAKKRKYVRHSDASIAHSSQVFNIQVMGNLTADSISAIKGSHMIHTTREPQKDAGDSTKLKAKTDTKKAVEKLFTEDKLYFKFFQKLLVRRNTETYTQALIEMVVFKCNEILPYFDLKAKLLTSVKPTKTAVKKSGKVSIELVEQAKLVDNISSEALLAIVLKRRKENM